MYPFIPDIPFMESAIIWIVVDLLLYHTGFQPLPKAPLLYKAMILMNRLSLHPV
jgi:hypothetical protein